MTLRVLLLISLLLLLLQTVEQSIGEIPHKNFYISKIDYFKYLDKSCNVSTLERDCGGFEQLVCLNNRCSFCNETIHCTDQIDSLFVCKPHKFMYISNQTKFGICEHKDLFDAYSYRDIVTTVLSLLGGILSSATGTGGGAITTTILRVFGRFAPSIAIPISTLMIFGAGIVNISILGFKRHPHADRPLIDYDAALMMEPPTLMGTVIGVLFNLMFPDWMITVLVIVVFSISSILMLRSGYKRYQYEQRQLLSEHNSPAIGTVENGESTNYIRMENENHINNNEINEDEHEANRVTNPFMASAAIDFDEEYDKHHHQTTPLLNEDEKTSSFGNTISNNIELHRMYEQERRTPFLKIGVLIICWLSICALTLLRGGKGTPSVLGIEKCSAAYWTLTAMCFPILGVMTVLICFYLYKHHQKKERLGYAFVEGDIHWGFKNIVLYPFVLFFGGIFSALLGIGGALIKSPILLLLGADPVSSQATTSFMILFTSSISTLQYVISGQLPIGYGCWFLGLGILSGVFGQAILDLYLEKSKRKSILIFVVTFATILSALLMTGYGIYDVVNDVQRGVYMGFKSPC
ncbi:hypothetical protein ABK040_013875 [Willaertia magna]